MGSKKKSSVTRTTEFGRTPLSDIFRGHLRSRIIRTKDQATDYVQPFFTLQLDIEVIATTFYLHKINCKMKYLVTKLLSSFLIFRTLRV